MTLEETIKKAIEGGYELRRGTNVDVEIGFWFRKNGSATCIEYILFDPLFWQCLGKAMGWDKESASRYSSQVSPKTGIWRGELYKDNSWLYHWYQFIDHLAEGGSIESFFLNL